jgi:CRISPR-associated endonuclease Cas3-HD
MARTKSGKKQTQARRTAMTINEAIGVFERAFWERNPNEVERHLREMLNVQVAVVKSRLEAERELTRGKRLKTVTVPFWVFREKVGAMLKEKKDEEESRVYRLEPNRILDMEEQNKVLNPVYSIDGILPGGTYALLCKLAGYSADKGLTFYGEGDPTGFELQPEPETREKFTEGHFQTWQDHAEGVWRRSERLAKLYHPFLEAWSKNVLAPQWGSNSDKRVKDFVEAVLWAMKVAVLLHDIGKLDVKWQEVIWENEGRIQGEGVKRQTEEAFIARTSLVQDEALRKKLKVPPPHALFAYAFVKKFLRNLLGEYRFLDAIALATARHHSLDVGGGVKQGKFNLKVEAKELLKNWLPEVLRVEDTQRALKEAIKSVESGSEIDEPPSPSDDFYFLYCLTNRMVKMCDWEDAGDKMVELLNLEKNDAST